MKKILKYIGIVVAVLVLIGLVGATIINKPLPEGKQGPEADALAKKMLQATKYDAFEATTYLEWTFPGGRKFQWYKNENRVIVRWKENTVDLNLQNVSESKVTSNNTEVTDQEKKSELQQKALAMFNNDSFWLIAPYKLFEPGIERRLVKTEDGEEALLITYTSGGTTPGDSYLWYVDSNGLPIKYEMWVSTIPIGGVPATWENWQETESGALLASIHKSVKFTLELKDIKATK